MATTVYHAPSPAPKIFHATLYDESVLLAKDDVGRIVVLNDRYEYVMFFEPEMATFCVVLGEAAIAATQQIRDKMRGGAVAIACSRAQEVQ